MVEKGNTMLRQLLITLGLALCAQAVHAAEAGKVIFVAGKAQLAERAASEGAAVQEGDMLTTGDDGFIYVKTVDNGLFILRPNTRARIAAYHVDAKDPKNTRIKLELLSGVARSRSGEAVKLARQNFRFNTPVAAIGVRGTDFTVFTDDNVSRVAVLSGGIVMSGFEGACRPEGTGPCEGNAARELTAQMRGQLLQFQKGQTAPLLMQGGALSPDQLAPPRGDEPIGKNSGVNSSSTLVSVEPSLDPRKSASLNQIANSVPNTPVTPPPVIGNEKPPVVVVVPPVVNREIIWGRWQPVADSPAQLVLADVPRAERIVGGNYVISRTAGDEYVAPVQGSIGFALKSSEAFIYNDDKTQLPVAAAVQNGKLNIDFGNAVFATSFDLKSGAEVFKMNATGDIRGDGRLFGGSAFVQPNNMNVNGTLSNAGGGTAAYIFQARLDAARTTDGITYWGK
jgi:hypothetical protein